MNDSNIRPLHANRTPDSYYGSGEASGPKKKFEAKGHDKQLETAQFGRKRVTIITLAGEMFSGIIVKRDRYSVTLQQDDYDQQRLFFKSAIEQITMPAPAPRHNVVEFRAEA